MGDEGDRDVLLPRIHRHPDDRDQRDRAAGAGRDAAHRRAAHPDPRQGGRVRRLLTTLLVAGAVIAPATPAFAHGGEGANVTSYRTLVTGISGPMDGLTVRTVEGGARLELTNDTGRPIEVLGYAGEPYLEIRPDGVYQNAASPAAYVNRTLSGGTPVPASADPT